MIAASNIDAVIRLLYQWAHEPRRRYVVACSLHGLMERETNPQFDEALSGASLILPDGMPLVWLARSNGFRVARRVCGPDLLHAMTSEGARTDIRHFFFGGEPHVAQGLTTLVESRLGPSAIAGHLSPPMLPLADLCTESVARTINETRPNVVWVGLGAPKQEVWMASMRDRLDAALLIGVGAAFGFETGAETRAPAWLRETGLEWTYRLARNPRRLWRRYLRLNAYFARRLLRVRGKT